jgi:phosphoglycolate phosphatase-like HAD superfamily hydrolase
MSDAWNKLADVAKSLRKSDRYVRITCRYRDISETLDVEVPQSINTLADLEASTRAHGVATHRAARVFKDNHGIHRCCRVSTSIDGPFRYND